VRRVWCVTTGIAWGLAILTRMSAIALLPAIAIYMWLSLGWKKGWGVFLLMLVCAMLTVTPWIWRNYNHTGRAFVTSHGAIELWFAYNKDTQHIISNDISVDKMRVGLEDRLPVIKSIRNRQELTPIEREIREADVFKKEAFMYVLEHPVESFEMIPMKLWKLWTWRYSPVPTCPDPRQDMLRRSVHALSYGLLLVLSAIGLGLNFSGQWRHHSLVLLYFVCYSALHAIIYGFSRLRWPIDQFLIIYAAYTVIHSVSCLSNRGRELNATKLI